MKREYWRYFPIVLRYLRPYRASALVSIGLAIVGALIGLAEPWPLAFLVDTVLGKAPTPELVQRYIGARPTHLILFAVLGGFIITLIIHGIAVISTYVDTRISQSIALDFRSDLFAHCERLSQSFHDAQATGDFMYRINMEAHAVGEMSVALVPLGQSALTLVGMFVVALRIDAFLALLSLVVVPFIYLSTGYYGKRIEPRQLIVRSIEVTSMTIVNEVMSLLRVVASFGREDYEYGRFREQGRQAVAGRIDLTVRQTLFSLAVALTTAAGTALVLGTGALHVLNGSLTAGQLLVVLAYIAAVYTPLQTISSTLASFQEHLIGIRYAKELLDTMPDVVDRPGATDIGTVAGHVVFDNVTFSYRGRPPALAGISFEISPGSAVAVVGTTGAGKTTLISLIPRYFEPAEGRVLIDGHDLRDVTITSLRRNVAFVHQEPLLFARTIAENIRYGRLDASDEEVVRAARAANAHDFIEALPEGYETVLGERGSGLSGGERQRLAIARAFVKDAPILILDEPTASIDSETEQSILDALDRLMAGRTTFIVAHRLSTVRNADWVLVLSHGHIIEQGKPEVLRDQGGAFARITALQTPGATSSSLPEPEPEPPRVGPPATTALNPQRASSLRRLLQLEEPDYEISTSPTTSMGRTSP